MGNIQIKRGIFRDLPKEAKEGELLYTTDTNELFVGNGLGKDLTRINDTGGLNSNILKTVEIVDSLTLGTPYNIPNDGILLLTSNPMRNPSMTLLSIKVNDAPILLFGTPNKDCLTYQLNVLKDDKIEIKIPLSSALLVYLSL